MRTTVAQTAGRPWAAVTAALDEGRSLAEACVGAGLEPTAVARLTAAGAGAWVDLLDGTEGARVLVAEHSPGRAGMRLAADASHVGFAETDEARGDFRRRWLANQAAGVEVDSEWRLAERGPWDLVIVDGLPSAGSTPALDARLRRLSSGLARHGRLVVVADNRRSPFRAADRAVGRAAGPPGPSLRSIEQALRRAGVEVSQRFGLLRSSVDAVTAFDLDAPVAASAIVAAATVNIEHVRAMGLRLLRSLAGHGAAAPLVPAWMVVGSVSCGDRRSSPSPSRPTGRVGHKRSGESKLVRGEPPVELEKRYSTPAAAEREAMALRVLGGCNVDLAPRLLTQPAPDRLRQTWHPGRPMRPAGLRREELRLWVARAAQTLGTIQRATERSDGTVLVHGDYWLGNVLVDGQDIVAVLDWTTAHWGDPTEDLHHLIDHLVEMGMASGREIGVLTELARAAHASP